MDHDYARKVSGRLLQMEGLPTTLGPVGQFHGRLKGAFVTV